MNEYQRALRKVIDDRNDMIAIDDGDYKPDTTLYDIKVLQELVHRTVPMKPIKNTYLCRNCDKEIVLGREENFCHHCGQALDWSER